MTEQQLLEHLAINLRNFVREFSSGIFALLGIFLGSWLTRRSELMRIRVERRTQIFDEACRLTAAHTESILQDDMRPGAPYGVDEVVRATIALNWKIKTHFSKAAYGAWCEAEERILAGADTSAMPIQHDFADIAEKALNALGAELK